MVCMKPSSQYLHSCRGNVEKFLLTLCRLIKSTLQAVREHSNFYISTQFVSVLFKQGTVHFYGVGGLVGFDG